jgi:hypothetical protein
MTQITLSRIVRTVVALSAAVLVVGCSQSGTPSAAPTSSSLPVASSASSPVPPATTPTVGTPSATNAPPTTARTTGEPATTPPPAPPPAPPTGTTETTGTDLAGEVYGRIVAVDPAGSTITLDKYDWFVGDAAQQACAEDGVTEHDNGWCTDYYFRNVNPMLRVLPVGPDASVSTLTDGSPDEVAGDLTTVQDRLSSSASSAVFRIVVTDGEVTSIREVYFP